MYVFSSYLMLLIKGFIIIFVQGLQNQHFFFFGLFDKEM